ncbi:MAG TPA: DUF2285 domain-containing protein [Allosphingosinicella sp.]
MRRELQHLPDWRDAQAYRALLGADRALIAWEWLRRDPAYCRAAAEALAVGGGPPHGVEPAAGPERWGLAAFEPPGLRVPDARPLWAAEAYPYVLRCRAEACSDRRDRFDETALAPLLTRIVRPCGRQYLLLSEGLRYLRLDLEPAEAAGDVALRYDLQGCASAEPGLLTLRLLIALCKTGAFPRTLYRDEPRAARWILQLRAHDALRDGCDQRVIASILLSRVAAEPQWRSRDPSVRSQVQRLVRDARSMADGGFVRLLDCHNSSPLALRSHSFARPLDARRGG